MAFKVPKFSDEDSVGFIFLWILPDFPLVSVGACSYSSSIKFKLNFQFSPVFLETRLFVLPSRR